MMVQSRKWMLAGALLLVFAAVKLAALYVWQQNRQAAVTPVACDVRKGCALPGGGRLKFSEPLAARAPFEIELAGLGGGEQSVYVSFSMKDMDMGFNRYDLKKQPDGTWRAQNVRLPLCAEGRHDYLADIHIGARVFQTGFAAE